MPNKRRIAASNEFLNACRKALASRLDVEDLLAILRDATVTAYRKARRENETP